MSEQQIGDLLRRGTEHLPDPDLVTVALEGAHRHRRRRTVLVGGVAALAVAAAIGVPLAWSGAGGPGDRPPAAPGPAPGPVPAAATGRLVAPAPEQSVVAPVLDPEDIAALPAYDAGLPQVLEPDEESAVDLADDPIDRAVAAVKADGLYLDDFDLEQDVFFVLGTDGDWRRVHVDAPADLTGDRGPALLPESLSPDGTKVALKGNTAVYVVDLDDGSTTEVTTGRWAGMTAWQPDSKHLLVPLGKQGFVVDVTDGTRTPAGWAADTGAGPFTGAYEPGGRLVSVADDSHGQGLEDIVESNGGNRALEVEADDLGQPLYLLPSAHDLAMSTYPMIATDRGLRGKHDGLLVVDRESYRTAAFLPVAGIEGYYTNIDALRPRAWLDEHTLLFSIRPYGTKQDESDIGQYFLVWDTRTGQVSRAAHTTLLWRSVSLLPDPAG
ncbi:hypothetical protein ncot_12225 [Nocardioides sp. JQ2195]|uniref:TolB family protein n=1 Tax=Nocardioides sp. JQ2195 TaxID=2592334 RepID=UPI00143E1112|nr:hypothetical protein [Nocardioides sp. JQ2195]QIX27281.1 hypothetical protein ncot_12225 [Nocardioides sp. JQ2195]